MRTRHTQLHAPTSSDRLRQPARPMPDAAYADIQPTAARHIPKRACATRDDRASLLPTHQMSAPGEDWATCAREERGGRGGAVAEIRRLHFVKGLSQREIRRRTGLHRDTIRKAVMSSAPPVYRRAPAGSKLDPFKDEIHQLLREDLRLPDVRIRELLAPLGVHGLEDGGRRLPARRAAAVCAAAADVPADGLSAGRALLVRCLAAACRGSGRTWPHAPRLGRDRVSMQGRVPRDRNGGWSPPPAKF